MIKALGFALANLLMLHARGTTIYVSPNGAVRKIAEALQIAHAGDTLIIASGIYRENNLTIDKPLVMIGSEHAIIDGGKKNEILIIHSNRVTVSGLTLRNGGYSSYNDIAAIRILNAEEVKVVGNRIENTFFGIYSQHASRCLIAKNTLISNASNELNSANGIHCWKSDQMQILDNSVTGHRDGIYFEFVTNSTIRGNRCYQNVRYGLHFMFSNDDVYESNEFRDNGAGVAVMFSHRVTMRKNRFSDNWGESAYGLLLKEIADGEISGNLFQRNSIGIYMEGTNRMNIAANRFIANGWAIKIQASCDGNTLKGNNFQANSFDVSTNGSLVLNDFNGNYWDKYEGYDLNRDGSGDVPYHPLSIYSLIIERNPTALMLFRSFIVTLLEKSEKLLPAITPELLKDETPVMKPLPLNASQ